MWRNLPVPLILLLLAIPPLVPSVGAQDSWWDPGWSYRQEITLPLDLHSPGAAGQPVDLRLSFTNPCWAQDATHSSVRVISERNGECTELESELYNLTYTSPDILAGCSLIFLIPNDVTGDEHLYAYYDGAQTPSAEYPDHVTVTTSSYYLEPIPGYAVQSSFYVVSDDGHPTYAVSYAGQFLYYKTAQYVTKLLPNATTVLPTTTDMLASFEFKYYYGTALDAFASTADHATSHEILRDGTLSASLSITSRSHDNTLQTTAVYTYYHTTTSQARIRVHADHTAFADCTVTPGASTDGTYAQLQCGGIHTNTIPELNIDRLYPLAHVQTTSGREEYRIDPNPEYSTDPVTRILSPTDDVDLGTPAWASYDEGTNGTAHALLFATTHVLTTDDDEADGIQANIYESNTPNLPGFRNDAAVLQCNRNSVTSPGAQDLSIPAGFHATYDAEFYTTTTGGYPQVQAEAACYPLLASLLPGATAENQITTTSPPHYTLTVHALNAWSMPLGASLSILLGKNYSFITATIYHDTSLVCSGTTARLTIHTPTNTSTHRLLSLQNLTLTKTIRFPSLPEGDYLIKIYRQHPLRTNRTQCIGYATVSLTANTTVTIRCTRQSSATFHIKDQHGQGIPDADVRLAMGTTAISWGRTDHNGSVILTVPRQKNAYNTTVLYKGFLLSSQAMRTPLISRRPLTRTVTVNLSQLTLTIVDTWNLPPEINLAPLLSSHLMFQAENLSLTATAPGQYTLPGLPLASYNCWVRYQSFSANTTVALQQTTTAQLVFPAEYLIRFNLLDSRGIPLKGLSLSLKRGDRTLSLNATDSLLRVSLPPGLYHLDVRSSSGIVASRPLQVIGPREVTVVVDQDPAAIGFLLGGVAILGLTGVLSYWKKEWAFLIAGISIVFIVCSLWFPWWGITGSSSETSISSQLFILPTSLVSTIQTPQVLSGELASLPDQFFTVMTAFVIGCVLGASFLTASVVCRAKRRRRLTWWLWVLSLLVLGGSLLLVLVSISMVSTVSVGGLFGSGPFQVTIPGGGVQELPASWGLSLGFFFFAAALAVAGPILFLLVRKRKNEA